MFTPIIVVYYILKFKDIKYNRSNFFVLIKVNVKRIIINYYI